MTLRSRLWVDPPRIRARFDPMRGLLIIIASASTCTSLAQYVGAYGGLVQSSGNEIVAGARSTGPSEFQSPGWTIGAYWAPKDSAAHLRIVAGWEHQEWSQAFQADLGNGNQTDTLRRGRLCSTIELVRVMPSVVFPVSTRARILAGLSLGLAVSATHTEDATLVRITTLGGSQSGSTAVHLSNSDTAYAGTKGLRPSFALEIGGERDLWKGLGFQVLVGVNSTFAAKSSQGRESGVPWCGRFSLCWRF